jgi:hypothetical protein
MLRSWHDEQQKVLMVWSLVHRPAAFAALQLLTPSAWTSNSLGNAASATSPPSFLQQVLQQISLMANSELTQPLMGLWSAACWHVPQPAGSVVV